jgi:iron complex transport system substrate-binding protein
MIYDMQLQDNLYGVTFECPTTALHEKLKVVRCVLEGKNYFSAEMDKIFSSSKAQGKSLYFVDQDVLEQISPDVIFTQDVCEVCQIDTASTAAAVAKLEKHAAIIPITPAGLEDVFASAITIATAFGKEEHAYRYLATLNQRIDFIIDKLRASKAKPKRVMLMEWLDPIYNCGHWIPDQLAMAGGIDMLSNPRGDSVVTHWEKVLRYDPEVLVIAPCGFTVQRTMEEISLLSRKSRWADLQAVKNGRVFIVDFELFTQPSASTLVDGIELLAAIFHPEIFSLRPELQHKTFSVADTNLALP